MPRFIHGAHGLIANGNRYLVVKRSKTDSYMPGKWDLPGGRISEHEKIEQALTREILEETGLVAELYEPLGIVTNYDDETNIQGVTFIYLCEKFSGTVQLSDEHTGFRWVTSAEMFELDDVIWSLRQLRDFYMGGVL